MEPYIEAWRQNLQRALEQFGLQWFFDVSESSPFEANHTFWAKYRIKQFCVFGVNSAALAAALSFTAETFAREAF